MLVECQLPLTSRRIDAVLAGTRPQTGEDSFVVIELKQWSRAGRYEESDTLVDVPHAARPRLHPGIQVGDYCQYLIDFLGLLADRGNTIRDAVYLHLLTFAAAELKDRSHFTLLDEQRVAYELVLHAVERARAADHKSVVVVSGGPGSGKSVIALSPLGELARQGSTSTRWSSQENSATSTSSRRTP